MPEALAPSGVETTSDSESVRPCSGLRVDLKRCLLTTDCCRKRNKTPLECLQASDPMTPYLFASISIEYPLLLFAMYPPQTNDVPDECQALRVAFFECKRSILDMRTRFRGRKGY